MIAAPKIMSIKSPTPLPATANFFLAVASGELLLLLGRYPAEESPALLFLIFCVFLLSSAVVMLHCGRSDPLWMLLTPEVMGKIIPPTPLLATAKFVLAVASCELLLFGRHEAEESPALLFLIFCFFLLSSAAIMLLCGRSDPLWLLLTPKIIGKVIPPAPPQRTAMIFLAVAAGGLLLLLGQHGVEESPALLFFMFCFFLLSSAAVMICSSVAATSPPRCPI